METIFRVYFEKFMIVYNRYLATVEFTGNFSLILEKKFVFINIRVLYDYIVK